MRKITEEEYRQLTHKPHGKASNFTDQILSLKVGEKLFIERKDWQRTGRKLDPVKLIKSHRARRQSSRIGNLELEVETMIEGWIITKKGGDNDV